MVLNGSVCELISLVSDRNWSGAVSLQGRRCRPVRSFSATWPPVFLKFVGSSFSYVTNQLESISHFIQT